MSEVKRYFIDGEDCFTVESENGDLVDYHDFDLLSQKLEIAMAALKQYEACICDDGDTYAAREAIQKIEAL